MALRQLADPNDMIEVPGIGERAPRSMSRQTLAEVIEPRVEELYSLVQQVLRESGFEELLSSGVVLTGGSSVMQGMVELGEEIFHMPVRVGAAALRRAALAEVVRTPRYATAVGLLLEGVAQMEQGQAFAPERLGQGRARAHAGVVSTQFLMYSTTGKETTTCSRSSIVRQPDRSSR